MQWTYGLLFSFPIGVGVVGVATVEEEEEEEEEEDDDDGEFLLVTDAQN